MLRGTKVVLRARKASDVPKLHHELFEDVATRIRTDPRPWSPTPVEQSHFKARDEQSDSVAVFTIADPSSDEVLGSCLLWGIDSHNRFAHIGLGLVPAARGLGLAGETLRLLCDYGFRIRGLHRIQIETLADNAAMIRAAESAGFVREAVLREAAWIAGTWTDELIFGLLAAEWRHE